jgi:basic amino acid/polyamine antiporter, APA family
MNLWATKSVTALRADAEATHERSLKRALGPVNLIMLGIGAIIGAGIFVLTGIAAALQAGPAVILSFLLAAVACGLAGLCYAEMASTVPVAGSAYTYSYATMGEFTAWIIGWDLVLEYALAATTVAIGWSGYVVSFLDDLGIHIPAQWQAARGTVVNMADGSQVTAVLNLPAALNTSGWVQLGRDDPSHPTAIADSTL